MQTIIDLYNNYHHPDTIRIIIAGILFIPFIYLITYKGDKQPAEKKPSIKHRGYNKLYKDISGKLTKEKELA